MEIKTITIDGQDFFLVPKYEIKSDVLIEPIELRTKKIFYVKTRYMWGKEYDQRLIDTNNKDGGWWIYRREEWENGNFTWFRMFGGDVEARKEDVAILESWYQRKMSSQ